MSERHAGRLFHCEQVGAGGEGPGTETAVEGSANASAGLRGRLHSGVRFLQHAMQEGQERRLVAALGMQESPMAFRHPIVVVHIERIVCQHAPVHALHSSRLELIHPAEDPDGKGSG